MKICIFLLAIIAVFVALKFLSVIAWPIVLCSFVLLAFFGAKFLWSNK